MFIFLQTLFNIKNITGRCLLILSISRVLLLIFKLFIFYSYLYIILVCVYIINHLLEYFKTYSIETFSILIQ